MGGLDPEVVHQPDRVGGHVAAAGRARSSGARAPCRPASAPRRDSILVERPMSRLSKRTTRKPRSASSAQKLLVPGDHLRRQAHHQQQRLAVGVADLLVGDLDPVGGRQALFAECGHQSQSRQAGCPARSSACRRGGARPLSWRGANRDRLRPAPGQRPRRGRPARSGDPAASCSRRSRGADRVVLLGDVLELRELAAGDGAGGRPAVLRGARRGDGGPPDVCSSPATTTTGLPSRCSTSSRSPSDRRSASSIAAPPPARPLPRIAGWLGKAELEHRLPRPLAARRRLRHPRPLHGLPHEPAAARSAWPRRP